MNKQTEKLIAQLNYAKDTGGDWETPYINLMKTLYNIPVLFFALSRSEFDEKTKYSVPLVSTKDFGGAPSLYVFSDDDMASKWMTHYKHVTDDLKYGLIGAVEKKNHDFMSVFQTALRLGVKMIVLDEGGSYVGIELAAFVSVNNINTEQIEIVLPETEPEYIKEKYSTPELKFSPVRAIPLSE